MATETLGLLSDMLARICGTDFIGVWSSAFGELDLRYGRAHQALLNTAHQVWLEARYELQDGRTLREGDHTAIPLLSGRRDLVGLVVLPVALPTDEPAQSFVGEFLRRITRHVMTVEPWPAPEMVVVPVDSLAAPGGIDAMTRAAYAAVMLRYGWNKTLAAHALGVPRLQLLRRLKRLGVEPPHRSPKSRRGRGGPGGPSGPTALDERLRALVWPRVPRPKPV